MSPTLDDLDRRILRALQSDASLTNFELSAMVFSSPATVLRRVRKLREQGVIERTLAVLSPERLGGQLEALLEVTLERQDAEVLRQFAARITQHPAVQQCYQTTAGPDFVLVVGFPDMPAYHAWVQGELTAEAGVRNVRTFFSLKRHKFAPHVAV